jgi:hypothetical protein
MESARTRESEVISHETRNQTSNPSSLNQRPHTPGDLSQQIRIMKSAPQQNLLTAAFLGVLALTPIMDQAADPLPSRNNTAPKQAIIVFVEKATKPGSPDFVPVAERSANFDNHGTLWSEQPMYFQAFFVFDRIKTLARRRRTRLDSKW